jgi:hypothetical protein
MVDRTIEPRPWRRFHASTYIVLLLTAAMLGLLNVPGRRTVDFALHPYERQKPVVLKSETPLVLVGRHKRQIQINHSVVHGWPVIWLMRDVREHPDPQTGGSRETGIWSFSEDLRKFYPKALAINVALALALTASVALLFESWRRKRRRLWQQTIRDWLVLIAVVGGTTVFVLKTAREYQRDRDGLSALGYLETFQNDPDAAELFERLGVITRTRGGPTWLQELLGDGSLPWLDRTIQLAVFPDHLEHLSKFPDLRALTVDGLRLTDESLSNLSQLKQLELLFLRRASAQVLAPGTTLAEHADPDSSNDEQAVAQLVGQLGALNRLQQLRLDTRAFGDKAAHVVSAFSKLRVLIVDHADALTDDGLAAIAQCKNLEVLDLGLGKWIANNGLVHLAALPRLKLLSLPESVDRQAVQDLQRRMPALKIEVGSQPFVSDK